jgi:uncharacterized YigZ family protein
MSPDDLFRVPEREASADLRVRGSRFLAFAAPAANEPDAAARVDAIRRHYHDATHVAFAWRLRSPGGARERSFDDGEPAGTAGAPILAAINAATLVDAVVAVVRYFGGTKLGTAGLVRAYGQAARAAIAAAGARVCYDRAVLAIDCPYARIGTVEGLFDPPEVELISQEFGECATFRLAVRRARLPEILRHLDDARLAHRLSD